MKRTGMGHPKLRRLARLLDLAYPYGAVGMVETLWHFTAIHAIRGNVGKWSDAEIADGIGWPTDDAARLIEALVDAGLVDRHSVHRLVIHDWSDHADQSTKKTLGKRRLTFANLDDSTLTQGGPAPEAAGSVPESFQNNSGTVRNDSGTVQKRSAQPEPEPGPEPEPEPGPERAGPAAADDSVTFDELMKKWNAIQGVSRCVKATDSRRKAFQARCEDKDWVANLDAALERIARSNFCRGGGERGWKADITWFLKPDSLVHTLEGRYDDDSRPKTGRARGHTPGPGQRYAGDKPTW